MVKLLVLAAALASAWEVNQPALWMERFFWDALLQSRDRLARQQSDPNLVPMMKAVAQQVAQQVANLQQINEYVKTQKDNLDYAFQQDDPKPSLQTIQENFDTLAKGNDQVRQNLYFLTVRCRLASSQALPDQEIYNAALLILGQVQQLQLTLNSLYLDTLAVRNVVAENRWGTDKHFRHTTDELLRSAARIQDSTFSIYNAGYELAMRSR